MKPLNKMTTEELIECTQRFEDCKMSGYAGYICALRGKLKEAITPNPDEIHIVWSVDDVYSMCKGEGIQPTLKQAREILRQIKATSKDTYHRVHANAILTDVLEGR